MSQVCESKRSAPDQIQCVVSRFRAVAVRSNAVRLNESTIVAGGVWRSQGKLETWPDYTRALLLFGIELSQIRVARILA